jgi:nucleotide-binding universal stress UspA family protein
MANPILVGYDPGRRDRAPVDFGIAAANFTGAPLIIGSAHAGTAALGPHADEIVEDELTENAGESLDHLALDLRRQGIHAECRALVGHSAAHALHNAAEEFGAGLLVVGSTERGKVGRLLPGSTADRLMHGAPCAVAVIPCSWEPGGGLHTLGVAYVDTPEGHKALDAAVALAHRSGAKLVVLNAAKERGTAGTYGGGNPTIRATGFQELASTVRTAAERAVADATAGESGLEVEPDVSVGDPADFLIAASERLDLLIIGSRGYGPTRAVLLGGVSRRVSREAQCPVIVLPRGAESSLEALVGDEAAAAG